MGIRAKSLGRTCTRMRLNESNSTLKTIKVVLMFLMCIGPLWFASIAVSQTIDVRRFKVSWDQVHSLLPDIESLETVGFQLRRTTEGLGPAVSGKPSIRTDIAAMNRMGGVECQTSALLSIAAMFQKHLESQGFMGVSVRVGQLPTKAMMSPLMSISLHIFPSRVDLTVRSSNLIPTKGRSRTRSSLEGMEGLDAHENIGRMDRTDPMLIDAQSVLSVAVRLGNVMESTRARSGQTCQDRFHGGFIQDQGTDWTNGRDDGRGIAKHLQTRGSRMPVSAWSRVATRSTSSWPLISPLRRRRPNQHP